ncbi:MAG: aldo/keto reductase [Ignavibacteria bacterium]|nr:aldo/keto reductase [Ignavibacteria bacterium]
MKYSILGKTGLKISKIGFGSYRVDNRIKEHVTAIEHALKNGINLFDTSSNYSDGGSEILIGKILTDFFNKKIIDQDEIVIVSKGGYIQGKNLEIAKQREINGNPYTEVVKCSPDLWHCISPEFLKDQITYSLERLQLNRIDVYLLHNPEYFLNYSNFDNLEAHRKEYYNRIKNAFMFLEEEVTKGRISYYGISSNTFPSAEDEIDFTSLEQVLKIANEVSSTNHFAVIQLPMNLLEKGGLNNHEQKSVLTIAHENGIGVLINRPLNAIVKRKLHRLTSFPIKENYTKKEIIELIKDIASIEEKIKTAISVYNIGNADLKSYFDCLSLGEILSGYFSKFDSPTHFLEMKQQYFIPRANYVLSALEKLGVEDSPLLNQLNTYAVTSNILLDAIQSHIAQMNKKFFKPLEFKLEKYLNKEEQSFDLSQKAVLMLLSLKEVSSVLVGMRKKVYVENILQISDRESIINAEKFFCD